MFPQKARIGYRTINVLGLCYICEDLVSFVDQQKNQIAFIHDIIGFMHDRIALTHFKTVYTHGTIGLTQDRMDRIVKNNVADNVIPQCYLSLSPPLSLPLPLSLSLSLMRARMGDKCTSCVAFRMNNVLPSLGT